MDTRIVIECYEEVVYDGSNGPDIVALFEGHPVSDDGQMLVFRHPNGAVRRAGAGDHILFIDNRGINDGWCDWKRVVPDETFTKRFRAWRDEGGR
jgi:hypothetical protein